MFRDKRKLALVCFSCFFFVEVVLLSVHVHIKAKIDRDEASCPVCQLVRGAVKFFYGDTSAKFHPLILVTFIILAACLIVSWNSVRPSPIRGPPIA